MSGERKVQTVVITGMSGSGKSTALRAFEDMGYYAVDNLPVALLRPFITHEESQSGGPTKIALVMDVREPEFVRRYPEISRKIKAQGFHLELIFLDAGDEALVRRFVQTRRVHPLAPEGTPLPGIEAERRLLGEIRELADRVIDTSGFNVHQLREHIFRLYAPRRELGRLVLHIMSFGFKYGVPAEANLVFDVRFLPNPYFENGMRELSGCEPEVASFVLDHEVSRRFMEMTSELLSFLLPHYRREGKSYLIAAVGCTGGRHRSVAVAEALARRFTEEGEEVIVTHRDLGRQ